MNHFVNNVLKYKALFHVVDVPYRDIHLIQNKVLKELKLKNLNELRDKFEGEQFYKNRLSKCLPIVSLEKLLKIKLFDWEKSELKNIQSDITISDLKIRLNLSMYGSTPEVEKDSEYPVIFFILNNLKEVWICGFASNKTIKKYHGKERTIGIGSKSKEVIEFNGFSHLKKFDTLEELLLIIKEDNE
ncbi:hypothetical protein [Chryseobacterium aureum]|uniref:hypothetical protein n=1 Tax=Chryseobacterium aureum TaxID=2497456 RepID=UPI000F86BDB7|nr:hypothetical protein [Chryseobacterium aureum]